MTEPAWRRSLASLATLITFGAATFGAESDDRKLFTQLPEVAPGAATPAPETPEVKPDWSAGPNPAWIWSGKPDKPCFATKTFAGPAKSAQLIVSGDNSVRALINGTVVGSSDDWQNPLAADVTKLVKDGDNVMTIEGKNQGGSAGVALKLILTGADGASRYVVTDASWQVTDSNKVKPSSPAKVVGEYGNPPWGPVFQGKGPNNDPQHIRFNTLPGFQVELLFTVPKDELGSWVCLTTDGKGRLIASDQGTKGLCRITPPPIGGSQPTKVELLDAKISSAQGMLWAFDSLYVTANGGPGSGLYRLRDTDGDDQFDEVTLLKEIRGGGEHGPHALRLSPDGKSIVANSGNHTLPPFDRSLSAPIQTMGGVRPQQLRATLPADAASRLAPIWDEDLLLPRQWDAGGHAVGIMAPGGWIAKTDPEGKTWEILASGFRNEYDIAFNADGELFAYDADMEWDFGLPWYRPTRVNHATSGAEFGWRSGSGKWPAYYVDSRPSIVDIGPGSPVGIEFGYGAKFPARYQRALFICDWTFGTMYAIHVEPDGSTYKGVKEEFLSRTPLPLTDTCVGSDGALYFTVGGRGAQSELFRVTYVGGEATAPVSAHDSTGAELRDLRRQIETYHVPGVDPTKATAFLVPKLGHPDRAIRYTARVGLERVPVEYWQDQALGAGDFEAVVNGVVGLARTADPPLRPRLLAALDKFDFARMNETQQLDWLRALQLTLLRLGLPEAPARRELGLKAESLFPAASDSVNRELAIVMVALESPNAAHKLVPLLARERIVGQSNLGDVLSRNAGYGKTVAAVAQNSPDAQQMSYVFSLRNLKTGWTLDQRKAYFAWFEKARSWTGGVSYQKYLTNIERDAFENAPDSDRLAIEAAGLRKPYKAPPLPKPVGPGRDYTVDELVTLSASKMRGRNFKNGQKMFAAARCVVCHRFDADGGSTGPDLTQAAGRFSVKDLAEAIVDPSKVVSDQYKTTVVQTAEGKSYTGRIVAISPSSITMLIDPEDSTKTVEIKKSDIEEQQLSPVSLMPKDLLKTLNEKEVLDLLAYVLSRGNSREAFYTK